MSDLSGRLSGSQAISGSLSGGSTLRGGLSMGGVSPELLLDKADVITDTASGSIVSIPDGMAAPAIGVSVDVEPIQDLHGYDNPWPAGGGKNLVNPALSPNNNRRVTNVTYVNGDNEVTLTTTSNENYMCLGLFYYYKAGTYTMKYSATASDSYTPSVTLYKGNTVVARVSPDIASTFTLSEDMQIEFRLFASLGGDGAIGRTIRFYHMQVESGSTATTWSPYSNICPISGRSEVSVTRAGKNLLDPSVKTETANNTSHIISVKANTVYTFSVDERQAGLYAQYESSPNTWTSFAFKYDATELSFNSAEHTTIRLLTFKSGNQILPTQFQLELGSTASSYEPYNGQTVTLQLGQTVYGGTLDVTDGKLVIADGMYTFTGDEAWTKQGNYDKYYSTQYLLRDLAKLPANNYQSVPIITSIGSFNYSYDSLHSHPYSICIAADGRIGIHSDLYNQSGDTLEGVQLCYELATPVEVTLTAEELDILFGDNNIWSDSGSVSCSYRADTKLWILKKIAQALNS